MSSMSQHSSATAVAMLVLSTAAPASALAKYGSPPLKPFQPSHSSPAPGERHDQVVRFEVLSIFKQARADHRRSDEAGDPGRQDG